MHRKHIIRIIPVLLIFLYSCQSNKNAIEISMKWVKDQPYSYSNIADIETEMNMMGTRQSIEVKTSMYNTLKMLQTDGKQHTVEFKYDSIANVSTLLNGKPNETAAENDMSFINGQSITMQIRDGKIVQVEQNDSLFASIKDSLQKQIVNELFSAENLNGTLSMYFNLYPEKPVSIGESWTNKLEMKVSSLKLSMKFNYTLKSINEGIAEISFTATSDDKGKMEMNGVEIPVSFKGQQNGTYFVKLDEGVLQSGSASSDFDMSISMAGMELPMKMKAKNEVKKL